MPSSNFQKHSNTAGGIITGRQLSLVTPRSQEPSTPVKHDTSSEALAYSKPHKSIESTKSTNSTKITGSTKITDPTKIIYSTKSTDSTKITDTTKVIDSTKSTDSTKITTSAHGSTRDQDDAGWDLVKQEHEQDDVASITVTDESEEDYEHLEASSGEEDYNDVRMQSGRAKFWAFRNLALYGPD